MTAGGLLLILAVATPLALLAACLWPGPRRSAMRLLVFAPLPALAAAVFAADAPPLVLDADRLRLTLSLGSGPATLLGACALLWSMAGAYARAYFDEGPQASRFAMFWLLTLTGSLGVFVAGDLLSFYLMFAVVSLSAYALVIHDATPAARRAGAIYLVLAILGEIALLLAFILLAVHAPGESLATAETVAALTGSPARDTVIALLVAGFGLKAGLAPFHVWLPLAHPAAPMPASAVLSGAIIKAGIIGLIRFLPDDAALPGFGAAIVAVGFVSVFYAVAIGVTQRNPKTVLAYSSMSQMGFVAVLLGVALEGGAAPSSHDAAFYAAHHVLAKGALFLAVGVVAASSHRRLWPVLLPAALLALGFAGLPPSGGYVAKLVAKGGLGDGLTGLLATLSSVTSALLMTHFLFVLAPIASREDGATPDRGLRWPWLVLAAAAVLLPWASLPWHGSVSLAAALSPLELWKGVWPVLLGALLALALRRADHAVPRAPEGDIVVLAERLVRAAAPGSEVALRLEAGLRTWPVAGSVLLALGVLLAAMIWAGAP